MGKTFIWIASRDATVGDLFLWLENKAGAALRQHYDLFVQGLRVQSAEGSLLKDCGVENEETVRLILKSRLKGGGHNDEERPGEKRTRSIIAVASVSLIFFSSSLWAICVFCLLL